MEISYREIIFFCAFFADPYSSTRSKARFLNCLFCKQGKQRDCKFMNILWTKYVPQEQRRKMELTPCHLWLFPPRPNKTSFSLGSTLLIITEVLGKLWFPNLLASLISLKHNIFGLYRILPPQLLLIHRKVIHMFRNFLIHKLVEIGMCTLQNG